MRNLSLLSILLLFSFIAFQCRKEPEHTWADPQESAGFDIERGLKVKTDLLLIVKDEAGLPVSGARVKIGNFSAQTNEFGLFAAKNVEVHENHGFVLVEKDGFFNGSRTFVPMQGGNRLIVRMLRKDITVTFDAHTGGNIQTGNLEIELGSGFVDQSGNAYQGQVSLSAKYLDPESALLSEIMPGDLRGADEEGEKVLESFGMLAAELQGSNGQKLQPATGNPATIKMQLSTTLAARATPEIPLWHFDEIKGIWVHEGMAVLKQGIYIGQVAHFSFWNYDKPFKAARINGRLIDNYGDAIPNVNVRLTRTNGDSRTARVNSSGYLGGFIPADEVFRLDVVSFKDEILFTREFGPFSEDTDIPEIVIYVTHTSQYSGTIRNCDGSIPANAYLVIDGNDAVRAEDGKLDFRLMGKDPNQVHQVIAISEDGKYSNEVEIRNDGEVHDIGAFVLCDGLAYDGKWKISYTAGGKSFVIPQPTNYGYVPGYLNFSGGGAIDSSLDKAFVLALEFPLAPDKKQVLTPQSKGFLRLSTEKSPEGFVTADPIQVEVKTVLVNGKEVFRVLFSGIVKEYDPVSQTYVYTEIESGLIEQE